MTTQLPQTQKSVIFNIKTNKLSLEPSTPVPTSTTEHILAVHATAITNGELTWAPFTNWPEHHVPCFDVSGTIATELPGSKFKIGDRVYGRIYAGREGAARPYTTLAPSEAAIVPEGLKMTDAASVPMSAHTAWQALFEQGLLTGSFTSSSVPRVSDSGEILGSDLAKGKRVLVLGAAGGVGLMAVQFAKLAGATVYGTASSRNEEFLRELGVDGVVNYTKISVKDWIAEAPSERKFDLVFDCVGGKAMLDGWFGVKEHGTYISVVPGFVEEPENGKPEGVRSKWFIMEARGEELERVGRFFGKGLRATVDGVWGLEQWEEAFKRTGSGHARGKVVIKVAKEEE